MTKRTRNILRPVLPVLLALMSFGVSEGSAQRSATDKAANFYARGLVPLRLVVSDTLPESGLDIYLEGRPDESPHYTLWMTPELANRDSVGGALVVLSWLHQTFGGCPSERAVYRVRPGPGRTAFWTNSSERKTDKILKQLIARSHADARSRANVADTIWVPRVYGTADTPLEDGRPPEAMGC